MPSSSRGIWALLLVAVSLFTTLAAIPRTAQGLGFELSILRPAGGEDFTGGTVHSIKWFANSASGSKDDYVEISYDVGGVSTSIATGQYPSAGIMEYLWTVPRENLTDVTVTVCVTEFVWGTGCDTSNPFQIDSTSPSILTRSPVGTNANPTAPITVRFSEPMNQGSLLTSLSISPPLAGLNVTTSADGIRATHSGMQVGVQYAATILCGAVDASDPGNSVQGCGSTAWTFLANSTPPAVAWTSPTSGARWSGGTSHELRWVATDLEDAPSALVAYVDYSPAGAAWTRVAGPVPGDAPYLWNVPSSETGSARLRIRVVDTSGLQGTSLSSLFTIDATPPMVVATNPADGQLEVGWRDPAVAAFSEAMDATAGAETVSLRSEAGPYVSGTVSWDGSQVVRFTPNAPLRASTRYILRVNETVTDSSDPGNRMIVPFESAFTTQENAGPSVAFTMLFPQCPPVVFDPSPPDDSDCALSGGSNENLTWDATDPEDPSADLTIDLEFSAGSGFVPLAGGLGPSDTYLWTVPSLDTTDGALRVRVTDSQGAVATDEFPFKGIDSQSPTIVSVDPAPDAANVSPLAPIQVTFSEPVFGTIGLRLVGGPWVSSPNASNAFTPVPILVALHELPLDELSEYEIVINGGDVRDGSIPGNPLTVSAIFRFRTAAIAPELAVTAPTSRSRWTAGTTHEIIASASDLHDAEVTLTAQLILGGVPFGELLNTTVGPGQRAVNVAIPFVDEPDAALRICAVDSVGAETCESVDLILDGTAPFARITPGPNTVVHPEEPFVLSFSESMATEGQVGFSIAPGTSVSYRWTRSAVDNDTLIIEHPRLEERRTYTATLLCSLRDASVPGLPLDSTCPRSWTFTTAGTPSVHLLLPSGGARLTGGAAYSVQLHSADEEQSLATRIDLSLDDGSTWVSLVDLTVFANTLTNAPILLPSFDTSNAFVRVTVFDSYGLSASAARGPFSIDATPPTILASRPFDKSNDVGQLEDFVLVFSESMSPSLELGLSSPRSLGGNLLGAFTWSSTREPFDTVRISHGGIRLGAAIRLSVAASDASVPGNPMSRDLQFKVVDDTERPYVRLAAADEAQEGDVIVFDASDSSDNDEIASYEWTIADDLGRTLDRIPGSRIEYPANTAGLLHVSVEVVDASGNAARASHEVEVHALGTIVTEFRYPPDPTLGWVALTGGASATAWSATDRARSFLSRMILLPLYVKMKGGSVLDNELRGMIRGYILVNPGDCYTDIKRNLQLENGELAYHLSVLEREGIIRSVSKGAKRVYYPAEMQLPAGDEALHEVQARILRHVAEVPGMSVHDLSGLVGVSSQLALYHMRKLGEMGYLRFERSGMKLRVFATDEQERTRFLRQAENA